MGLRWLQIISCAHHQPTGLIRMLNRLPTVMGTCKNLIRWYTVLGAPENFSIVHHIVQLASNLYEKARGCLYVHGQGHALDSPEEEGGRGRNRSYTIISSGGIVLHYY